MHVGVPCGSGGVGAGRSVWQRFLCGRKPRGPSHAAHDGAPRKGARCAACGALEASLGVRWVISTEVARAHGQRRRGRHCCGLACGWHGLYRSKRDAMLPPLRSLRERAGGGGHCIVVCGVLTGYGDEARCVVVWLCGVEARRE
eukprot:2540655-Prymnesium_polylepis.1